MQGPNAERLKIDIRIGAPPEGDVIFLTSDGETFGSKVVAEFFPAMTGSTRESLTLSTDGFSVEGDDEIGRLVYLSMSAPKMPVNVLLGQRVRAAMLALESELPGRLVWMPVIADGEIGLGVHEGAAALSEGIADYLEVSESPPPREITVALPFATDKVSAEWVGGIFDDAIGHAADVYVDGRPLAASIQNDTSSVTSGKADGPASNAPEYATTYRQSAPFQPDQAATVDRLNRAAVAKTLGTLIDDVWKAEPGQGDASFMIHLHGRWGSGKTSILNFLKEELASGEVAALRPKRTPPWLFVDYNAWRNQGLGPAWWTVLKAVYDAAIVQLRGTRDGSRQRLRLSHLFWRMKIAWLPTAITAIVTLVALYVVVFVELEDGWPDILKNVTALATFLGTVFLLRGEGGIVNSQTARRYVELARDPLGPLTARYEHMIGDIDRPVAVMIDDLDRCDAEFVVELLQTVQTLYRGARVLYVVAADRDWLCRSYEKIYADFSEAVAEPGRSLGHLFVEKVFQLSVEVPPLLDHQRDMFWNELIRQSPQSSPEQNAEIEKDVAAQIENLDTEAKLIEFVQSQRNDATRASIVGAQVFRRMQSAPLQREREHFLSRYADLLEPNPRAMKRLLNAYGFRRGFDIQSVTPSDPDALARWTILENRWPVLADHLSGRSSGGENAEVISRLLDDDEVRRVAAGLTWESLRPVPGAPDDETEDTAPITPPSA